MELMCSTELGFFCDKRDVKEIKEAGMLAIYHSLWCSTWCSSCFCSVLVLFSVIIFPSIPCVLICFNQSKYGVYQPLSWAIIYENVKKGKKKRSECLVYLVLGTVENSFHSSSFPFLRNWGEQRKTLFVFQDMLNNRNCRTWWAKKIKEINNLKMDRLPRAIQIDWLYDMNCSYEREEMEEYVLHLLVLSHAYVVPWLKRKCEWHLEKGLINLENVTDVFQLALLCDAPRLSLICHRMIMRNFEVVSTTEGWKVMKQSHPILEKELLDMVMEDDNVWKWPENCSTSKSFSRTLLSFP